MVPGPGESDRPRRAVVPVARPNPIVDRGSYRVSPTDLLILIGGGAQLAVAGWLDSDSCYGGPSIVHNPVLCDPVVILLAIIWAAVGLTTAVFAVVSFVEPRLLRPFGLLTALLALAAMGLLILITHGSQFSSFAVVVTTPAVLGGALSAALPRRGVDRTRPRAGHR